MTTVEQQYFKNNKQPHLSIKKMGLFVFWGQASIVAARRVSRGVSPKRLHTITPLHLLNAVFSFIPPQHSVYLHHFLEKKDDLA
ncbi:MAG: hypothetical protein AB8B69_00975 [Chitinophagales bacterium]